MAEKSDAFERRSKLSPAKRALFEKRLRDAITPHAQQQAIQRRPNQDVFPLSFAQERFWFLDQLNPGSPVYNSPMALHLTGSLDMTALEQALSEILHRHEVLRATFANVAGRPVQVINPAQPLHLPVVDLSELPTGERKSQARRLATEETQRPIDLARGPLLRATLLHLDEEEHILLLVIHHLVCDAWSANVFTKELATLYEAFSAGNPSPLSELPIQYADFAYWQRHWLQGETLERQLSYWKKQLDGAPPVLELPTDRPRPAFQTQQGSKESAVLSTDLAQALQVLSRREGVTLFATLLAAFKTLLYRYTGQEDIVVGFPIAGRTRVETEGLIGLFINTLVLRINLSNNPTFRELLGQVQEAALGAYAHQDIPFEKLVEELQPERDMSRTPLFQVMFNFKNLPEEVVGTKSLRIDEFEFDRGTSMFDLALEVVEKAKGLSCRFLYNTGLFDTTTISRTLDHYQTLLESAVTNPDQRIGNLPLLTEGERHQMLVEWNNTKADYPKDKCIHQLFEAQVEQTPEAIAVVFEDRQLTYRELNERANQLAHYLRKLGVGPEVLVGICVERSLEMVLGLMGILKAGGTYVPLDPTYPQERLAFMLEDTKAPVLLTQEHLRTKIPENKAEMIFLDSGWEIIAKESKENLSNQNTTENLAYVMYTSGATGKPKGVMISHRNVVGFLHSFKQVTLDGEKRIGTSLTTFSFDVSVEEIFSSLCFGGSVHIIRPEYSTDVEYFANYLVNNHITTTYILPDFLRGISSHLKDITERMNLKCVITGLAPKKERLLQSVRDLSPQIRILNAYGPTEVTYGATAFEFHWANEPDRDVPIGRPFPNYEVYIVDSNLQPVPIGVVGELLISGIGLARGYLNRPELTAEKFIHHPFSDKPGARIYKTGDLCRFLPDGNIDFIGRFDHQVKVRGFRIELGEIETVLKQHSDVQNTVVLAREDRPGDKRLVAYVVPKRGTVLKTNTLHNLLKEKLPSYMIPSNFVFLEALPLTLSGKVDRGALPAPDWSRPDLEVAFVVPRTPMQSLIAKVWQEALGVQRVSVYDNFFDLGGHSLLSIQVIARLEKKLGVRVNPREFIAQTLGQLASCYEEKANLTRHSEPKSPLQKFWCAMKRALLHRSQVLN